MFKINILQNMGKKLNLVGQVFGRLTVIEEGEGYVSPSGNTASTWDCQCSCGNTTTVIGSNLVKGTTNSCGCLSKELTKERFTIHGKRNSKEYQTWVNIKQRCLNPKANYSELYSERGITICDEWLNSFEQFYADMRDAPGSDYSIDRINNDLGYSKDNCRWVKDESCIQCINQGVRKDNTSGVKGVCFRKRTGKWEARISVNKKRIYLGSFINKADAIAARKAAEEKYYKPLLKIAA